MALGNKSRAAVFVMLITALASPAFADSHGAALVQKGSKVFRQCAGCHQVGPGAWHTVGPHLNGVFGRRAGTIKGVEYSTGMMRAGDNGLHWNPENLDQYIRDPRSLISMTRMRFRGVKDEEDRAAVIAYLRTFSDDPRDIPEAAPTATAASHDPAVNPDVLAIQGDPAFGEYLSGECVTCHRPTGEDSGIPSIVGWPRDIFVTAMHSYRAKIRAHPVMQMIAGPLSDEEIASLAAYFATLE